MVAADPFTLVGLGLLGSAVAGLQMPLFPPVRAEDWSGWVWPVAPLNDGRAPVVSQGYKPGARFKVVDGKRVLDYATHLGLDIMFPWREGDPIAPPTDVVTRTSPRGRWGYYAPSGAKVRSAGPGKVWSVQETSLGLSVTIDHGKVGPSEMPVVSFYQHLETYAKSWQKGDVVAAGDELGDMGGDPANRPHLRHLHFELWFPAASSSQASWPADPAGYMKHWRKDGV